MGIRSGTEEPRFTVIGQVGTVQIRTYAPRLAASVTVPGDEVTARSTGFRRLAGFIFGGNTSQTSISMTAPVTQTSAKIAMTAPVVQSNSPDGWVISFIMPAKYTIATLPKPNDPGIKIVELPAETDAVVRFTGIPNLAAVAAARQTLRTTLAGAAWQPAGAEFEWFYDPPWTVPFLRRNEVGVAVIPRP